MKTPPDALFCAYDQMAVDALYAMYENNLHAPEDMASIGFDNITVSKYIEGGLTTTENPCVDMISIAVSILAKRTKSRRAAQQIAPRPNLNRAKHALVRKIRGIDTQISAVFL